jgi:DNA-binding MarR family transcriptional regulator
MMMTDKDQDSESIDLIISLLARIAFKNDDLKQVIQKGSMKPREILVAYNLCDGKTPITTIARKAHIAQPSLTNAVAKWEQQGIALKKKDGGQVMPMRLFRVE